MRAFKKVLASEAAPICERYPLSEPAAAALSPGIAPDRFVDALVAQGLVADAIQFLAFALPKREATWWACVCARDQDSRTTGAAAEASAQALGAAESWVYKPREAIRRVAMERAEATAQSAPGDWAAAAAGYSSGSLAPPGDPELPPADHLTPTAVTTAILLAMTHPDPAEMDRRAHDYLDRGLDIARGGDGRTAAAPSAGGSSGEGRDDTVRIVLSPGDDATVEIRVSDMLGDH